MRTGFNQGPKGRIVGTEGGTKMNFSFDKHLVQAIKDSVESAFWLTEADEAAVMTAILLAETMQEEPGRRHQLAPILIGLLNNLGLLGKTRVEKDIETPESWLDALKHGE